LAAAQPPYGRVAPAAVRDPFEGQIAARPAGSCPEEAADRVGGSVSHDGQRGDGTATGGSQDADGHGS
jgi:hypothetical protein